MQVHPPETLLLPASVVAVGAFDGVHRGHQALIRQMWVSARQLGVPTVIYTFDPPPRSYFQDAQILTPLPEKLRRLRALGVDHTVVAHFDAGYVARSARAFIEELADLHPLEIWVGPTFRFGKHREGGVDALGARFTVRILESVRCCDGKVISSSRVRALLEKGALEEAQLLLNWKPEGAQRSE